MIHPAILLVLIMVAAVFAVLGAVVLRLTPRPGLRWSSLVAFVICATVGAAVYAFAYVAIFGDGSYGLSDAAETYLLISIPIVGSIVGWLGAAGAARLAR